MKKTIYSKFDKKLITELPIALFPGRIITIINENDADKAVDYLLSCDILGVDTTTYRRIENGQHRLRVETLITIAKALGTTIYSLLEEPNISHTLAEG